MRQTTIARFAALTLTAALGAGLSAGAHAAVYASSPSVAVPDQDSRSDTITITDTGTVTDLSVTVGVDNTWLGDLIYTLSHSGTAVTLMDRPGRTTAGFGDNTNLSSNAPITFSMSATVAAETMGDNCGTDHTVGVDTNCINTQYLPEESLAAFFGGALAGDWTLTVSDNANGDATVFQTWSMNITTAPANEVPEPTGFALAGLALAGLAASRRRAR